MSKIGILGGTFDPFHKGHESIGLSAMEEGKLDYLYLLPANVSPFKIGRKMVDEKHRLAMLMAYSAVHHDFKVSTIEIDTDEISYTYETMEKLKEIKADDQLYFIMGTDSFMSLETWHRGPELLASTSIIVGKRNGVSETELFDKEKSYIEKYGADILIMKNEILEISSTEIKKNLVEGLSISHLVPEVIDEYIKEHKLYR